MKNTVKEKTYMQFLLKKDSLINVFILNSSLITSFHKNHIWIAKYMNVKYMANIINSINLYIKNSSNSKHFLS